MDLTKKIEPHFPAIEKVLFLLMFFSVLLNWFIPEYESIFSILLIILQVSLIAFYFIQLQQRLYALIWAGFVLSILSIFLPQGINKYVEFLFAIGSYVVFGIIVLIKTIQLSYQHKNFELLTFIMGFLLVFQLALPFLPVEDKIITFYSYALTFSIGMIIYNDNLWHRFTDDEKNIIKYILIIFLIAVLKSSFKYMSI